MFGSHAQNQSNDDVLIFSTTITTKVTTAENNKSKEIKFIYKELTHIHVYCIHCSKLFPFQRVLTFPNKKMLLEYIK